MALFPLTSVVELVGCWMLGERVLEIAYEGDDSAELRRIVCRAVYEAEGRVYLDAYCLKARENRNFRRDRIQWVSDVARGVGGDDLADLLPVQATRGFAPGFNAARDAAKGAVDLLRWTLQVERLERSDLESAVRTILRGAEAPDFNDVERAACRRVSGLADVTAAACAVADYSGGDLLEVLEFCLGKVASWPAGSEVLGVLEQGVRLAGLPVEFYETAPPTTA